MEETFEQMYMDLRLQWEKNLRDNVTTVIKFAYEQRKIEKEEAGDPLPPVRSKHEGYGIAAEAYQRILGDAKMMKKCMEDYAGDLGTQGSDATNDSASLYSSAMNMAIDAIGMAADMTRVLNDLYYKTTTPIEEWNETPEKAEEDGYEEAGENDAEELEEEENDGEE